MGKVIVVAGAKGGTGKTTTAVSVAYELTDRGHDTLLWDLDPQASATKAVGVQPGQGSSVSELVASSYGFRVRPGGRVIELSGVEAGGTLGDDREAFDRVVVDLPPTIEPSVVGAVQAADLVVVPLEASPMALPALLDIERVAQACESPATVRAILVRFNTRRNLSDDIVNKLQSSRPGTLYRVRVPEDVKAAEAAGHGRPVGDYAPSSRVAEAYRLLTNLIEEDVS